MEIDSTTTAPKLTKNSTREREEAKPTEEDLYLKMKDLESQLEILEIQEDYLKDEQRHLKSEYIRSKEEVSTLPRRTH